MVAVKKSVAAARKIIDFITISPPERFVTFDTSCRINVLRVEGARKDQELVGKLWESYGI
jgi:hypothetical protein